VPRRSAIHSDLVLIATGLFVVGFVSGVLVTHYKPGIADALYKQMVETFTAQFEGIHGAGRIYSKIFLHNLSVCAIMTFGGIVFAVPPVFILLMNGIPLGIVLSRSEKPLLVFVGSILPHGIFELPATFLAGALGILLGIDALKLISSWMKGNGEASTRILLSDLRKILTSFLLVVLLLMVAAAIETFLFIVYGKGG